MSKKNDIILLLPGAKSWQIWKGTPELGFQDVSPSHPEGETILANPSELEKIPSGRLIMGFPVREALAIPFNAQTDDPSMFKDLAAMHLEKIGVRVEEEAGQLTDVFFAGSQEGGVTSLLTVVLAPPESDTMPRKAPQAFDITPRLFPLEDNALTFWEELGRWVFAVKSRGSLVYFQSLPGTGVTTHAIRDVRLALNQLKLQGVDVDVQKAVVWGTDGGGELPQEKLSEFASLLGVEISFAPKPAPVLPDPLSSLVPADVKAERKMKAQQTKRNVLLTILLLGYLGGVIYFIQDYVVLKRHLADQESQLKAIDSKYESVGQFYDQWDELEPVVESDHWPLTILKKTTEVIPRNQQLRLKVFDAKYGRVSIQGEAVDVNIISNYSRQLRRHLSDYVWSTPPAQPDRKTKRRIFNFQGMLKGLEN